MTVVQDTLVNAAGDPLIDKVTVDLLAGAVEDSAWVPDSKAHIIFSADAQSGSDGTWSVDLIPNDQIDPAGTVYRATVGGQQWLFVVPSGAAGPLWLHDLLTVTPPQLGPVFAGVGELQIGTVTTGAPGTDAAADITGTGPLQTLDLTIPRGNTGGGVTTVDGKSPDAGGDVDLTGEYASTVSGVAVDAAGAISLDGVYPRVTTPQAHGAKGDGVTDDTAAFQAAIDSGATVYVPPATYLLASELNVTDDSARIVGAGPKSRLNYTGSGNAVTLGSTNSGTAVTGIHVQGLRLSGTAAGSCGLYLAGVQYSRVEQVKIDGFMGASAYGLILDTQGVAPFVASRSNLIIVEVKDCNNGIKLAKDPDDPGTDGSNFNMFFGPRVHGAFGGIGINIDAGEFNCFFGVDSSSTVEGAVGVRINDSVTCVFGVRADNSSGGVGGGNATGIQIDAGAGDYLIMQPSGNGPINRIKNNAPANSGVIMRQAFNTWIGDVVRSLAETTASAMTQAWRNDTNSTINVGEVAFVSATDTPGGLTRWNAVTTNRNLLVCTETAPVGGVGQFAVPGSVCDVIVDAPTAVGDTIVGSSSTNGSAGVNNAETDPRKIIGFARSASGGAGTVKVYVT